MSRRPRKPYHEPWVLDIHKPLPSAQPTEADMDELEAKHKATDAKVIAQLREQGKLPPVSPPPLETPAQPTPSLESSKP